MGAQVTLVQVANPLTRTSGYLKGVTSHSLQPYRGCTFGRSLCGVACYVRSSPWVLQGREWGGFLEVRANAAEAYRTHAPAERRWAREKRGSFAVFLASATDPFVPQERRHGVTRAVLEAMLDELPDELVVQTHSPDVERVAELLVALSARCAVRVHVSIESDRDELPGLPPPVSSVARRIQAVEALRRRGLFTVVTVAPLLPLADPDAFIRRLADAADAVVVDHFIGGDGTDDGARTLRTALPAAMARVDPDSVELAYRDRIVALARAHMPGRVGVGADGFAGRFLPG